MSNSKRLAYLVDSAYKNNDLASMQNAYQEYQSSQCYYPEYRHVYDAHTQTSRIIRIPCGRCYHCMESKVNEWVTRMYAHAEDFKHVYFVTLTYRSFPSILRDVERLVLDKLQDAIWNYDYKNKTKHLSYNPCLLVKSHYQNFLKRLRKNTGLKDISYVLSGEYGKEYGRPHFHMILFTNGELTKNDIIRAWSVLLWRDQNGHISPLKNQRNNGTAFHFPIGRVDFNDLVTNGTFNTTARVRVDGQFLSAARCFAYVCKYVCKRDSSNLSRVSLAYSGLFEDHQYVKVFNNEVQYSIIRDYLSNMGYPYERINDISNHLNHYKYEKVIFNPKVRIFNTALSQFKNQKIYGFDTNFEFYPSKFVDFRCRFSPFCEFSRGCPIGSVYASRNISQFTQGVFTRPILQDKGFVVPSYFRRKAQDYLYGLRICNKTIKSTSFCYGPLINLYGRFQKSLSTGLPLREHIDSNKVSITDKEALQNPLRFFRDAYSGERIIFRDGFALSFKYSRSSRDYVQTSSFPLAYWIRTQCNLLKEEFARHDLILRSSLENEHDRDYAFSLMTDSGLDPSHLRNEFVQRQNAWLHQQQITYDEIHASCE